MYPPSNHSFHIPVMGIAYTIDSPVKVARYGISSVISIVEDRLIELMRRHYYPTIGQEYVPITTHEVDYRAKRITDYLNLINTIVNTQVEKLRNAAFEKGSEIVKYFEMLPDDHRLKILYHQMVHAVNQTEKQEMEILLREQIRPGSIDVNIMTKTDRDQYTSDGQLIADGSDAVAALRGYARSNLANSSVVFSAGMNPRVYAYLETCPNFDLTAQADFTKKIIVKVSDYRSALIQGKYLAKKGIWVSEFRIESGLNCGGHAFATDGYLMGPILEEFKKNRQELIETLFELYAAAMLKKGNRVCTVPPPLTISAQGGIGTHEEDDFLHRHYGVTSTGWGTPFLLVPEATTVDEATLTLLCEAKEKDVYLSRNSPLGVPFYGLKGTTAEKEKRSRIQKGKPGSPCTEKHLAFNTEFTKDPICTASYTYQKLKVAQLKSLQLPEAEYESRISDVLTKECLCIGLSNPAALTYKQPFIKKLHAVTICPGPNIAHFSNVVSLQTMVDHIYGRKNIMSSPERPHMFIKELLLYIEYLKQQLKQNALTGEIEKKTKYYEAFMTNLNAGISYYRELQGIALAAKERFLAALNLAAEELDSLYRQYMSSAGHIQM